MTSQPKSSNIINCIIIDDEPSSQTILKKFISDVDFLTLSGTCNNAVEAIQLLNTKQNVDLMFLDINMPKISGLTFYRSLQNPPDLIFTTAYSQYAVDGFEVNAIDYLLKPFSFDRFLIAISKVIDKKKFNENNSPKSPYILIKSNKTIHKINPNNIEYIEALGDYVKVHLKESFIITNSTFTLILKKLRDYKFIQTHKSYAINLEKVNRINGNQVFIGANSIPIGQKYKTLFLNLLNGN